MYRACTQSITVDEALTYNHFIANSDDPVAKSSPYNDNLNTLLCRVSVLAGLSEFSLRLPSLLGGLLYLIALFRLCRLLFGDSVYLLLAVAVNSLNPFVLDHLSAARGYGMGLGFWTLGAYYLARWVKDSGENRAELLLKAGVALGLSVASHVTEVFGVVALEIAFVGIFFAEQWVASGWRGAVRFLRFSATPLCVVTVAVAAAIVWTPLSESGGKFIDGVTLRYLDGPKSLVREFLFYKPTVLTSWMNYRGVFARLVWLLIPALLIGLLAASALIVYRWARAKKLAESLLLLFSLTVPLALFLLWIEPRIFQHGYFTDRRLLFILPLTFLACPLWLQWLSTQSAPQRAVSYAGAALLTFLTVCFVLQFNLKSYLGSEHDAASKRVVEILRARHSPAAGSKIRIGADMSLNESFNFYRRIYGIDWIEDVTAPYECTNDYYYVLTEHLGGIQRFGVQEIFRDTAARTALAELGSEARRREAVLRGYGFTGRPDCAADLMTDEPRAKSAAMGSERHLLRGFMPGSDNHWRWTYERPVMLFHVPKRANTKFVMDFVINRDTFEKTGPQRLTVMVNGKPIGEKVYGSAENHSFEQPVPERLLREDGIALVETTLDKYYTAADDKQKMGYLFLRGGFVQ